MNSDRKLSTGYISHREHFSKFVSKAMIEIVVKAIGHEKLLASDDIHFNDIPLQKWDRISFIAMRRGFSLSDCVCTVKEAAKQYVESHEVDNND